MKRLFLCLGLIASVLVVLPASAEVAGEKLITGNMRIVIGSKSTGGDTYQNSAIIAQALAEELGIDIKVDAVGSTAAFKTMERTGQNGNTLMIFHDQSYLTYLYGIKGSPDVFKEFKIGPTIAINPGNAYLVPKNSPYQSIDAIIDACGKGTKVRVAIQPGGVSEIGFTAMKNAVKLKYPGKEGNLVAINTGSQSNKNQLLFDDQADVINGSVQANEQYTRLPIDDQKAMRFVWLTARQETIAQANPEGMGQTSRDDLMKYVEAAAVVPYDAVSNFVFDKEFFFVYNKKISPELVAYIDDAMTRIYAKGEIQKIQKKSFFIPDFLPSTESGPYLIEKMERIKTIIDGMK